MARKTSMGRQKIEIKRINCEAARQVTFSKRRAGLFKKASELSTLCGAETAILVFSPAGKVFSFGHPGVEFVVERFLKKNSHRQEALVLPLVEAHRGANVRELNQKYTEMLDLVGTERKRAETLNQSTLEANQSKPWWEAPIENMGLLELHHLMVFMEDLKKNMSKRVEELLAKSAIISPVFSMNSMGTLDHFAAARATQYPNSFSSTIPTVHGYSFSTHGRGFF